MKSLNDLRIEAENRPPNSSFLLFLPKTILTCQFIDVALGVFIALNKPKIKGFAFYCKDYPEARALWLREDLTTATK